MFDNLGTAIVQAFGFFGVFVFFVYQLISEGKKPVNTRLKSPKKKVNELKDKNDKPKRRGLFGKKNKPIKEEVKPKEKRLFGRKEKSFENLDLQKKKGWFK